MTEDPQNPYATRPYPQGPGAGGGPDYGGYQAAPAPGPYPYAYPYPPRQGTNTLAILALVFAFVFAPAAIVLGACARRQIRRTGEEGWGLATAGMIVGIVFTVLSVIWIVVVLTVFVHLAQNIDQQQTGAALWSARTLLGV